MAGLVMNGSMVLGPSPGAPVDLPAYLASIGKADWYGRFLPGLNMYASSADLLTPVTTDGASVGQILPYQTAGGFSAVFRQTNNALRPVFGTARNGKPGIYGNGVDWFMSLSSTTELNRTYTLLVSAWVTYAANGYVYSHGLSKVSYRVAVGTTGDIALSADGLFGSIVTKSIETTPVSGATAAFRSGHVSSGAGFYNVAPDLFRYSNGTNYTNSTIHEIWLIGAALTPREISGSLKYLA